MWQCFRIVLLLVISFGVMSTQGDDRCYSTSIGPHDALLVIDVQNDFLPQRQLRSYPPRYNFTNNGKYIAEGSLAVTGGDEIIDVINVWADEFRSYGAKVIASLDWHPPAHCSFCRIDGKPLPLPPNAAKTFCPQSENDSSLATRCRDIVSETDFAHGDYVQWIDHCVQGDFGSRFDPYLAITNTTLVVKKGFLSTNDSYSAFGGYLTTESYPFDELMKEDLLQSTPLKTLLEENDIHRLWVMGIAIDYCVKNTILDALGRTNFPNYPSTQPATKPQVNLVLAGARGVAPTTVQAAITEVSKHGANVLDISVISPAQALLRLCGSNTPTKYIANWVWVVCAVVALVVGILLGFVISKCFAKRTSSNSYHALN